MTHSGPTPPEPDADEPGADEPDADEPDGDEPGADEPDGVALAGGEPWCADEPVGEAAVGEDVARAVIVALRTAGSTLATAESLTGGWIGAALTSVPGASEVYRGGLITYATDLKSTLAGVADDTLRRDGPVAASTAAEMASGVARRCGSVWGLSVTGVAGPDPQDGHPVGQVFVGIAGPGGLLVVSELSLRGSRGEIRRATVEAALQSLLGSVAASSSN